MDGRHFRLGEASPEEVGYKAMAVNLSDIAAMAGVPVAAFVAVALPRGDAGAIARGLHRGISGLAQEFGVTLAGGDTNAWDGPLVVTITLIGEATARGAVRRSGARPGDAILVTGALGGSLASRRHLRPRPRVAEALALAEAADLHAMIDLSDGLASDLGHILDESGGLGAHIEEGAIPIHPDAHASARSDGRSPLDHALADGEDFELCFTLGPSDAIRLLASPPPGLSLHRVGTIEAGAGLRLGAGGRDDPGRRIDGLRPPGGRLTGEDRPMLVERTGPGSLTISVESEAETDRLGRALAEVVRPGDVIGLVGTLGAGKTRLTRSIAEALGVDPGAIASPTFVLIHEYEGRMPIYHFDAYRLDGPDAFDALGASDYWSEGSGLCLIEWADLVADRLPPGTWWVRIDSSGPEGRVIRVESPEARALADRLAPPAP